MKIVLLGLKGVGKTTLGMKLGKSLGLSFVDTDGEMEKRFGGSPRELYIKKGEKRFRELEHEVLGGLQNLGDCVIAVGGGGFVSFENQVILRGLGRLICLHMSKENLLKRWKDWPPFCKTVEEFNGYYDERVRKLTELSCVWIDATRNDLADLVVRVCHGK